MITRRKILNGLMAVMFAAVGAGSFQGGGQLSAHSILWLQQAKVCSDPGVPCRTSIKFEAYDLPFQVPKNAVIWETEKFYAIILKSVATEGDCDRFVSEDDRLKAQALFPNAKVFASRPCNPGGLFYTNTAQNQQFMAVYAGRTKAQADRMLETVKATGNYPGANIRRMNAGFNGT